MSYTMIARGLPLLCIVEKGVTPLRDGMEFACKIGNNRFVSYEH